VLAFVVLTFVSHPSLLHWTPTAATLVIGVLLCLDGNFSGCGINPARWLGTATVSDLWKDFPAYYFGPFWAPRWQPCFHDFRQGQRFGINIMNGLPIRSA
jgi:glycerol uptake facilitator-like aquaporin